MPLAVEETVDVGVVVDDGVAEGVRDGVAPSEIVELDD